MPSCIDPDIPHVHIFLRTRNSIANTTAGFSRLSLKTDMTGNTQAPSGMNFSDVNPDDLTSRALILRNLSHLKKTKEIRPNDKQYIENLKNPAFP